MAEKRDFYEVLGVAKTATAEDIKKAYKKLALQYHPDRHVNDSEAEKKAAEEKFKEAAEAYEVLSNPQKRQRYDQFGFAGMGGASGFSGAGMDMSDIFAQFGDLFESWGMRGGGFSSFFGGGGGSPRTRRGNNLRVKVKVTLEEVATGVEKKIKVRKAVSCPHCNGTGSADGVMDTCPTCKGKGRITRLRQSFFGQMQQVEICPDCEGEGKVIKNKCPHCGGEGIVRDEEVITIQIPAGVAEGMELNVPGKGNAAPRGGVPGNLLVLVEEEPHKELVRVDNDLVYNLLISVPTAALGAQVEIPTLQGKVKVPISAGTQPGKVLRLRGKGLPQIDQYGRKIGQGDLLVNVTVYIPEKLSKDEKAWMEQFAQSPNAAPTGGDKKSFFKNLFGG
ncbi:MAG: molecular chaperone DnaJ [Paludibacteraceae bacterium]|nr:molecular chaperone DnaJ [Paludibacteraceae bacterium]